MGKGYWKSVVGNKKRFDRIGHQHLSNILWFKEVFNHSNETNDRAFRELSYELRTRYDGKRKKWKPLPIPNEISWIKEVCQIDENLSIIFKGKVIGTLKHISHLLN